MPLPRNCYDCGVRIVNRSKKQRYCNECQDRRQNEGKRKRKKYRKVYKQETFK